MLKNTADTRGSVAKNFHWLLFLALGVAAVLGHAGAALHHYFIRNDHVLKTMSPWAKEYTDMARQTGARSS